MTCFADIPEILQVRRPTSLTSSLNRILGLGQFGKAKFLLKKQADYCELAVC